MVFDLDLEDHQVSPLHLEAEVHEVPQAEVLEVHQVSSHEEEYLEAAFLVSQVADLLELQVSQASVVSFLLDSQEDLLAF